MDHKEADQLRKDIRKERPDVWALDVRSSILPTEYLVLVKATAPAKARDSRTGRVRHYIKHSQPIEIMSREDWEKKKDSIRVASPAESY